MRQVRMLLLLLFKRCAATLNVGLPSLIGLDNSSKNKDDNLAERDDAGRQSYQDNSWENRDDDQAERDDAGRQSYQDNSWENRDDDQAERDDAGR